MLLIRLTRSKGVEPQKNIWCGRTAIGDAHRCLHAQRATELILA